MYKHSYELWNQANMCIQGKLYMGCSGHNGCDITVIIQSIQIQFYIWSTLIFCIVALYAIGQNFAPWGYFEYDIGWII